MITQFSFQKRERELGRNAASHRQVTTTWLISIVKKHLVGCSRSVFPGVRIGLVGSSFGSSFSSSYVNSSFSPFGSYIILLSTICRKSRLAQSRSSAARDVTKYLPSFEGFPPRSAAWGPFLSLRNEHLPWFSSQGPRCKGLTGLISGQAVLVRHYFGARRTKVFLRRVAEWLSLDQN